MKKSIFLFGAAAAMAVIMMAGFAPRGINIFPSRSVDTGSYMLGIEDSAGNWTNGQKFKINNLMEYLWSNKDSAAIADTSSVLRGVIASGTGSTITFDTSGVNVPSFFSAGYDSPVSTSNATCVIDIWYDVTALSGSALDFVVDYTDETGTLRNVSIEVAVATGIGWAHYVARVEASHGLSVGMVAAGGSITYNWGMNVHVSK